MYRFKRTCDIVFSLSGIFVLSPIWLFVGLLVKITSRGDVIFRQTRVGYKGRKFQILKFRTMEEKSSAEEKMDRISVIGKCIRRLKLDELPQLVNILCGDMSFVGPRPYIVKESEGLPMERYEMRPGLTGLAQVNGNRELSWEDRTAYDLEYVREFSLWMDVKILLRTVLIVIFGEKACVRRKK